MLHSPERHGNRCLFCDRKSTLKSLTTYATEHYPNAAFGVYPIENDSKVAIIIVSNKYSPNNFW